MMEDINVIQLLDKIKKNIERGAVPIAVRDIDGTILVLEKKLAKAKGKKFREININELNLKKNNEGISPDDVIDIAQHHNEVVKFLNERFPV